MKAQIDSTFWYDYFGNADYWLHQPDAFAFKTFGGSAYTGWIDTTTVDSVVFQSGRNDKANEVYFKSSASATQIQAQIISCYQSGQIEYTYPVITKNPFLQNYMKKWYVMDNLLLVSFRDSLVDTDTLDAFMNRYNLTLYSGPDPNLSPPQFYFPYIFKIGILSKDIPDYPEYAQLVYERESALVEAVSPNIVNLPINGKAFPISNSTGTNPNQQCVTSDPEFPDLWQYTQTLKLLKL